jgi:hypothetical protein
MNKWSLAGIALAAAVVIGAGFALPDTMRYLRIRRM